eukprot:m51a1_g13744 hypothetical protein (100) ;mRNA; r:184233-186275
MLSFKFTVIAIIYALTLTTCCHAEDIEESPEPRTFDQYSLLKPESISLVFDSSYAPKPATCAIMDEFLKAAPQPRPHTYAAPPKSESSAVQPQPKMKSP